MPQLRGTCANSNQGSKQVEGTACCFMCTSKRELAFRVRRCAIANGQCLESDSQLDSAELPPGKKRDGRLVR